MTAARRSWLPGILVGGNLDLMDGAFGSVLLDQPFACNDIKLQEALRNLPSDVDLCASA